MAFQVNRYDLRRSVCKNYVGPFSLFLQQMNGLKGKKGGTQWYRMTLRWPSQVNRMTFAGPRMTLAGLSDVARMSLTGLSGSVNLVVPFSLFLQQMNSLKY